MGKLQFNPVLWLEDNLRSIIQKRKQNKEVCSCIYIQLHIYIKNSKDGFFQIEYFDTLHVCLYEHAHTNMHSQYACLTVCKRVPDRTFDQRSRHNKGDKIAYAHLRSLNRGL